MLKKIGLFNRQVEFILSVPEHYGLMDLAAELGGLSAVRIDPAYFLVKNWSLEYREKPTRILGDSTIVLEFFSLRMTKPGKTVVTARYNIKRSPFIIAGLFVGLVLFLIPGLFLLRRCWLKENPVLIAAFEDLRRSLQQMYPIVDESISSGY